ncbi:MAG TPA: Maf family protein, partial [Thermoplasmata archaeon]|nr:Maf family protein [Thermoplasmata archaeon]
MLTLVGARFACVASDVDEAPLPSERAEEHVLRLSEAKARGALGDVVARDSREAVVILGADTIVTIDREILGKPSRPEEAERMLARLSGRVHEVWTGLAIVDPAAGRALTRAIRSIVKFAPLSSEEISRYVAT